MPQEITAYRANDGSIHETACAAATSDLEGIVQASPLSENQPYAKKLVEWLCKEAPAVIDVLTAYRDACPKPPEDSACAEEPEGTRQNRISAAMGQMQERGEPAKAWLTRNGYENLADFGARVTDEHLTAWEHYADDPKAFGNGSEA